MKAVKKHLYSTATSPLLHCIPPFLRQPTASMTRSRRAQAVSPSCNDKRHGSETTHAEEVERVTTKAEVDRLKSIEWDSNSGDDHPFICYLKLEESTKILKSAWL